MKRLFKFTALLAIMLVTIPVAAQTSKFYKGVFEKETPSSVITAKIDFYGKTIDGENGEKCYGTIEIATERGVTGYDVVAVNSIDMPGAEPSIEVESWNFPGMTTRVAIEGNASAKTLWLDDWDSEKVCFKNVTLKKK